MKLLLLGGSGFIGSQLAHKLIDAKHDVTIVGSRSSFVLAGAKYKQLDFVSCTNFDNLIKDSDIIVHMVSTIIPSDNLKTTNQEISDNVFPTTLLLESASKFKKKLIFISSGGTIYGENSKKNTESSPTNPICNYGISKLLIEKYLFLYNHFYGLNYSIIRLSNPYSETIYHGKKQGVVPIIIEKIINNEPIEIWGKHQIRDFIHIDDVIEGIIDIINYDGKERIFNLGSGTGHTVEDIISIASAKLHKTPSIKYGPSRKCDVKHNVLDISLITRETKWQPTLSLEDGIDKVINNKLEELRHE